MKLVAQFSRSIRAVGICQPFHRHLMPISFLPRPAAMNASRRTIISPSQWTCRPRQFPVSGFELLDSNTEIEEETLLTYKPENYYPVQQGEVLNDRRYIKQSPR